MKKIGILTFHRSINFGAYMQSFALSNRLAKAFPDCRVEIIDYESKIMAEHYKPKFSLSCIKHPTLYPNAKKRYKSFQKSLAYLKLSDTHFAFDGINHEFNEYIEKNYDIVVVGSDAVWNWIKRGFPNNFLLPFNNVKKCSYAASAYGMDMTHVGENEKEYFADCLKNYFFIGVRDDYTKSLVNYTVAEKEVCFTCDPTVFLDLDEVLSALGHTKESFKKEIFKKYSIPEDKKLIGVMETSTAAIDAIKKKYGDKYHLISLYNDLKGADTYMANINPLEWSLMFGLFEVTLTNYFHGTLLSIRNGTPVICFDRTPFSKSNEGKIHDVLRRMDLLEFYNGGQFNEESFLIQIDKILESGELYRNKIQNNREELSKSSDGFIEAIRCVL